ncbi:hypothetical protein [Fortiea contorta]|uniref:hypothetical protein n=1 Tax=Fortiea contorta TaxID=1892405 RepID=UPI000348F2D1|nr:hypothetical protein [Fortiea contorta]
MNAKMFAPLVIIAFAILESPVQAQQPITSKSNSQNYLLTGDSLVGVDHRTSQEDFSSFFEQNQRNSVDKNANTDKLHFQESPSLPETPIFLLPTQSFNGNDGAQLKLDLNNQ